MSDSSPTKRNAAAIMARLKEPAKVEELNSITYLMSETLISVLDYMIADYKLPDEDAKRKAIDSAIKLLRDVNKFQRTLTGLTEADEAESE